MDASAPALNGPNSKMNNSLKVDVPSGGGKQDLSRLPTRRRRVQERLAQLDMDGDGMVSKEELIGFIEDTIATETQVKYLKWAGVFVLVFTIILLACIAGLIVGITKALRETRSSDGALVSNSSGSTLRTASASYMQPMVTAASTTAAGRRLLQTGADLVGTIPTSTVATYCKYLHEGYITVPTSATFMNGSAEIVDGVSSVQITGETKCVAWVAGLSPAEIQHGPAVPAGGVSGTFTYDSDQYAVDCEAAATNCTLLITSTSSNSTATSTSGRRLRQADQTAAGGNCFTCKGNGGCFPASAEAVTSSDGGLTTAVSRMDQLRIGDKVLTRDAAGNMAFEDIYVFGHQDAFATAPFVRIHTEGSSKALELTGGHFVPTLDAAGERRMLRASDVRMGQTIMVAGASGFQPRTVTKVSSAALRGLYNPFTLGGEIVVNGVLASAHSEWFLDGVVPDAWAHRLPATYQAVLTPARMMYRAFGVKAARRIDAAVGFASIAGGAKGGFGNFAIAVGLALRAGVAGMINGGK